MNYACEETEGYSVVQSGKGMISAVKGEIILLYDKNESYCIRAGSG